MKIYFEDECFINVKQASEIIGKSERTVKTLLKVEKLNVKHININNKIYLLEQDVIEYAAKYYIDWSEYITVQEAMRIMEISIDLLKKFAISTKLEITYHPLHGRIILKEPVFSAIKKWGYDRKKEIRISDICKYLVINRTQAERHIRRLINQDDVRENLIYGYIINKSIAQEWINKKNFDSLKFYTFNETKTRLSIDWLGIYMLINKGKLHGESNIFYNFLLTKDSVDVYHSHLKFLKNDCASSKKVATELGVGFEYAKKLMRAGELGELFISDFKNEWFVILQEVEKYKIKLKTIQNSNYTYKELLTKYDSLVVDNLFKHNKEMNIQGIVIVLPGTGVLQKLLLKKDVDRHMLQKDPYLNSSINSFRDAEEVFRCSVSELDISFSVKETFDLFYEYALDKMNKSVVHGKFHREGRRYSNVIKKLCVYVNELEHNSILPINQNVWLYSHEEIDQLMKFFTGDQIGILKRFLKYCLKRVTDKCKFGDANWKIIKVNKDQEINIVNDVLYSKIEDNMSNIELHLNKAIGDREYAMKWLFILLHFSVGWRPGDKANLKAPDLSCIRKDGGIIDFAYILEQGLSHEEAYRVRNQYHYTDLRANKSKWSDRSGEGKELNFTVKKSHLIVLMTAIIICTLHSQAFGYKHLICNKHGNCQPIISYEIRRFLKKALPHLTKLELDTITPTSLCNVFMSRLLYGAAEVGENSEASLILTQASRGHTRLGNTLIMHYIAQLKDGPWYQLVVQLCNENFFGGSKLKLIEIIISLCGFKPVDKYDDKVQLIQSIDEILNGITGVEHYATALNTLQNQKTSLAMKIIKKDIDLIDEDEFKSSISALIRKEMPAKIRDAQCLAGGLTICPYSLNTSCKGCEFLIPEDLILISIGKELKERARRMALTSYYGQMQKEFTWIYRLLKLVHEAMVDLGEEVIMALLPNYDETMELLNLALKNKKLAEYELN